MLVFFFFSSRRRHTRFDCDWSSDVCSSDVVTVTLAESGARWQVVTDAAGRYFLENVQVGGPYLIEARAVGFRPAGRSGVRLGLGQRYRADFVLEPSVVELPDVTVSASVDPRSEEHTSELQSQSNLVCRLLLEKKKN